MKSTVHTLLGKSILMIGMLCVTTMTIAEPGPDPGTGSWYAQLGAYGHYSDKEEYRGRPLFGGLEYTNKNRLIFGMSVFDNSFGDFTQYAYVGKAYHPSRRYSAFRVKLTVGIVHGYQGKNHKILPLRWGNAWGIGAVPTVGYQRGRLGVDLGVLSASGLILLMGYEF